MEWLKDLHVDGLENDSIHNELYSRSVPKGYSLPRVLSATLYLIKSCLLMRLPVSTLGLQGCIPHVFDLGTGFHRDEDFEFAVYANALPHEVDVSAQTPTSLAQLPRRAMANFDFLALPS